MNFLPISFPSYFFILFAGNIYIVLVLKQSTKGNQTTISNGETPDQVSACKGSKDDGLWHLYT